MVNVGGCWDLIPNSSISFCGLTCGSMCGSVHCVGSVFSWNSLIIMPTQLVLGVMIYFPSDEICCV